MQKHETNTKNTKKYEDSLKDQKKNLLTKSCNIDPCKPHSENLNELTNPYFNKSPTKPAPILTKYQSISEVNKNNSTKVSSSSATTTTSKATLPQTEDLARLQNENEFSSFMTSTKLKKLHPWCISARTREEIKDRCTENTSQVKKQFRSTLHSSDLATMEHSEQNEKDLLETSSDTVLSDNIQMGSKREKMSH